MSYKISIYNKNVTPKPKIYEFTNVPEGLTGTVSYYTNGTRQHTLANFVNNIIKYPQDSLLLKNMKSDISKDSPNPVSTSTFIVYYLGDGETFNYSAKTTVNGVEYEIAPVSYSFEDERGDVSNGAFRYALHYNDFIIMDFDKDIGSVRGARGDYRVKITNCNFFTYIRPKEVTPTYSLNFEATENISVNPTKLTAVGDIVLTPKDGYVFDSTSVHIDILNDSGFSTGDSFTGYTAKGDVNKIVLSFTQNLFDGNYNLRITSPVAVRKPSETYTLNFTTNENVVATPTSLSAAGDIVLTPKDGYVFDSTDVHIDIVNDSGFSSGESFKGYTAKGDVNKIVLSFTQDLFDDNYTLDITSPIGEKIPKPTYTFNFKTLENVNVNPSSISAAGNVIITPKSGYVFDDTEVLIKALDSKGAVIRTFTGYTVTGTVSQLTLSFGEDLFDDNYTLDIVKPTVSAVGQTPPAPDNVYLLNNIWLLDNDGVEELTKPYFTKDGSTMIAIPLSEYCSILCRIPFLITPEAEKVFKLGNATSRITQWYTNKSIHTFDFGSIKIEEKFKNYTAYEPYVMYNLWLPMLGYQNINSEDIVGHTVSVKLIYNVYTNMGSYVVSNENNIIATFGVRVAEDLPLINRTADGLTQTMLASQLTENMDAFFIEKDYGATDLSSESAVGGHVVNGVSQVKDHNGYLKCEAVDLNGLSTYSIMAEEINNLLLSGIIV